MQQEILALLADEIAFSQESLQQALNTYPQNPGDPSALLLVLDTLTESALALEVTDFLEHTQWITHNLLEAVKNHPDAIPDEMQHLFMDWLTLTIQFLKHPNEPEIQTQLHDLIESDNWPVKYPESLLVSIRNLTDESNSALLMDTPAESFVDLSMPEHTDHRLWQAFMQETPDLAKSLCSELSFDHEPDFSQLESIAHTIKGGANLVGIKPIADLCDRLENIFELLNAPVQLEQKKLLQKASSVLETQFAHINESQAPQTTDSSHIIHELDNWLNTLQQPETLFDDSSDLLNSTGIQEEWVTLAFSDDVDSRLVEAFFQETPDIVSELTQLLSLAPSGDFQGEKIIEAQRLAHTLKGSAALVGLHSIENLAHKLEDAMELLQENEQNPDSELAMILLETGDTLESLFDAVTNQESGISISLNHLIQSLDSFNNTDNNESDSIALDTVTDSNNVGNTVNLCHSADLNPLLWDAFMQETPDLVDQLYLNISENAANLFAEKAHEAETTAHTIKGAGKLAGIDPIADLAYALEEIFETLADTNNSIPEDKQQLLIQAADILQLQFTFLGNESAPAEVDPSDIIQSIYLWKAQLDSGSSDISSEEKITDNPPETLNEQWIDLSIPGDVDERLVGAFFEEAPDQAAELAVMLQNLTSDELTAEQMTEVQRLAHTVKGGSALLGLSPIEHLTHRLEDVMDTIMDGGTDDNLPGILLEAGDLLESMFDALINQEKGLSANLQQVLVQLDQYIPGEDEELIEAPSPVTQTPTNTVNLCHSSDLNPLLWDAFMQETPDLVDQLYFLISENAANLFAEKAREAETTAHTIKGSGKLVGIDPIADLGYALEEIFETLSETSTPLTEEQQQLLITAADILQLQFSLLGNDAAPADTDPSEIIHSLYLWKAQLEAGDTHTDSVDNIADNSIAAELEEQWIDLTIPEDVDERLVAAFFEEAPDQAAELASMLQELTSEDLSAEQMTEVQRLAHTVKGGSALLGLSPIEHLTHRLEDVMDTIMQGGADDALQGILLEAGDLLESMFDALTQQEDGLSANLQHILQQLDRYIPNEEEFAEFIDPEPAPHNAGSNINLCHSSDLNPLLWDAFMQETPDLVDQLYLSVSENAANLFGEKAHEVETTAHTIKGSGKLVGIDAIADLAYALEEIFEALAETSSPLPEDKQQLLIDAADILQLQFSLLGTEQAPAETDPTQVIQSINLWKAQLDSGEIEIPSTTADIPSALTTDSIPDTDAQWIDLNIPDDVDERLVAAFFEEAPDQAAELAVMLQSLTSDELTPEQMTEVQRLAHTVKGSSALLGLSPIEHLTHRLEDVMDTIMEGKTDDDLQGILLEAGDLLETMFDALTHQEQGINANLQQILHQLDRYIPAEESEDTPTESQESPQANIISLLPAENIGREQWELFLENIAPHAAQLIELLLVPNAIQGEKAQAGAVASEAIQLSSQSVGLSLLSHFAEKLHAAFQHHATQTPDEAFQEVFLLSAETLGNLMSNLGEDISADTDPTPIINKIAALLPASSENVEHSPAITETRDIESETTPDPGWTDLSFSEDLDPRLIEAFFAEAPDQAAELSAMLQGDLQNEHITEAQRLAHTIKGSAALLGIKPVETLAHRLEDVMEGLQGKNPEPELSELFLETGDFIESLFDALIAKQNRINQSTGTIINKLSAWAQKLNPDKLAHDQNNEDADDQELESQPIDPKELLWDENANPDLLDQFFLDGPENVEQLSTLLLNNQVAKPSGLKEARQLTNYLVENAEKLGISLLLKFATDLKLILDNVQGGKISDAGLTVLEDAGNILTNVFNAVQGVDELQGDISAKIWLFKEWAHRIADQAQEQESAAPAQATPETTVTDRDNKPKRKVLAKKEDEKTSKDDARKETPKQPVATTLRVPTERIDALIKLVGEMTTAISQLQGRLNNSLGQIHGIQSQGGRSFSKLQELDTLIINKHMPDAGNEEVSSDFDPLEMDQYHELNSISSFLNESFSDSSKMAQYAEEELSELNNIIHLQERLSREVNEAVLATRMLPVDQLTPRLERAVREAARASSKKAKLEIIGEELLIDTDIVNGLRDPLMHLLRNSVDHGIEKPADRLAKGKSEQGTIRTTFMRQGNTVFVSIQDDGAGFNLDRIKQTAASRGLSIPANVSETEILRLILQPGFSTKESVTKLSGRGIGMDVVAQAVSDLNGTIQLSNRKEGGSEITLRLPLTLVSAPVLLVKSVEQIFAIPGDDIHQILFPEPGSIYCEDDEWYFKHVDTTYYLHSLNALLGREEKQSALERHTFAPILLVHDEYNIQAVALDFALERRDVVIQRLGKWLPNVPGVSGACILADGSISPILDLKALLHNPDAIELDLTLLQDEARLLGGGKKSILVVDDSLSARLSLQLAVEQAGYEALNAIDGLNAVEILEENSPICVVTDMEMPRMNGLELTRHVKSNSSTSHLPVIMITSRSTAKHRNEAKTAGVDHYLTKPFDNTHLHEVIEKLTSGENDTVTTL